MRWKRSFLTLWLICLCALLSGCIESGEQPILISLSIEPVSCDLEVSRTAMFTAIGIDQNNNEISVTPTWTVSNGVGTVSPVEDSGTVFTATKAGIGKITATVGSITASANIKVTQTLTSIEIEPAAITRYEKTTTALNAVGRDRFGNQMEITPIWSVTGGVGTITPTAGPSVTFTATTAGSGTIVARVDDISGECAVTIEEEPTLTTIEITPAELTLYEAGTGSFTATGWDQYGNSIKIAPAWSVSNGIGSVSPDSGEKTTFSATTVGTGLLVATVGNVSGEAELTVRAARALNSLTINPTTAQMVINSQKEFTVTGIDQYGDPYPVEPTWTITNNIGSISPGANGKAVVTATKTGSGVVTASVGTITTSAAVSVYPVASEIIITPASITLSVGESQVFSVKVFDETGTELSIKPVWIVTNQLGSLLQNADGTVSFTAEKAGVGAIIASVADISGSADIVVNASQ